MTFNCAFLILDKCCSSTTCETLTLLSEVTSAGHQEWGWISATQASPVYDINKLVSNVLGTVDAG